MKKCTHCNIDTPTTRFSKSAVNRDGLVSWCKQCRNEHGRKYSSNPVRRAYNRKRGKQHYHDNRAAELVRRASVRAAKMGVPFALAEHVSELQARIDAGVCELSGIPFDFHGGLTFRQPFH